MNPTNCYLWGYQLKTLTELSHLPLPRVDDLLDGGCARGCLLALFTHGCLQYGDYQQHEKRDQRHHKPYAPEHSLGRAVANAPPYAQNQPDAANEHERIKCGEVRLLHHAE